MKSRNVVNPEVRTGLLHPSSIAGAVALMFAVASAPTTATELSYRQVLSPAVQQSPQVVSVAIERPRIQLAIILDTSNSMDGLIEQTRNQLWQVVNEFSTARQDGVTPILEIALFEFGNSGISRDRGYVRMLNGFTRELDAVSQGLFSLTTNGGDEYCGYAIETAVEQLQWSHSDSDIKTIFIAGNESFAQGPIAYQHAITLAARQGISINTIHAGTHQEGIADGWQAGAMLAGGDYLSIDANQQVVHIEAPQDTRINELNTKLNATYVPYGAEGADKVQRQQEQDQLSSDISVGLLAKRAQSKASAFYANAGWDLVDALKDGEVAEEQLAEMEEAALPEPMRGLSAQQKLDYLQQKQVERESIREEIIELGESRASYVAQKKKEQAAAAPGVSDALSGSIRKQAQQKNFSFAN
ncbi:MAG: VWA domain-containing protein [Gammaproteobacteria bacterium]|nr:VWA domain-containing protein [Gammaproteobacteria bacterium]